MVARRHLLLAVVVLAAGCTASPATTASDPAPSTPPVLPAATGFRVELAHKEQPAPGPNGAGQVAWESSWRLSWEPVAGATSYAVFYGTSEGTGDRAAARQSDPVLTVQAAAGTSTRSRLAQDRRTGLLFTSSQLLVAVRPEGAAGPGPRSLWFPVGDVPPDGRPIGTAEVGGH